MSNHDLKPFPFCGGEAKFDKVMWGCEEEACIVCTRCNALFTVEWINPARVDLADTWNRRVSDAKNA